MKIRIIVLFMLYITISLCANDKEFTSSALIVKKVFSEDRKKNIEIYYWYPTKKTNSDFLYGHNKIFEGTKTNLNAKIIKGKFPIILLAHGGIRSSPYHSTWIASSLAKLGFIVAVPQIPKANELKANLATNELWLRPSDLSLSLSDLEKNSILKNSIDTNRVYGVGFFLGGTSMLSLAGANFDLDLYKTSCDNKGINIDCEWFKKNKVDLKNTEDRKLTTSMINKRIKSIVVINPELTKTLTTNSIKNLSIPVGILDIRANNHKYPELDLADSIKNNPNIKISKIADSNIFSAFSICTKKGKIIFKDEQENICKDSEKSKREDIHKSIINKIVYFLI